MNRACVKCFPTTVSGQAENKGSEIWNVELNSPERRPWRVPVRQRPSTEIDRPTQTRPVSSKPIDYKIAAAIKLAAAAQRERRVSMGEPIDRHTGTGVNHQPSVPEPQFPARDDLVGGIRSGVDAHPAA